MRKYLIFHEFYQAAFPIYLNPNDIFFVLSQLSGQLNP